MPSVTGQDFGVTRQGRWAVGVVEDCPLQWVVRVPRGLYGGNR